MTRTRLVLVHGAASGPWVFREWDAAFADVDVRVPDLQQGLDVARASMDDYADRVEDALGAGPTAGPAVVCGWSMGGLVAMIVAGRRTLDALVLVEPSLPREVGGGADPGVTLEEGVYSAEERYGPVQPGTRHRPESLRALSERRRGISVPAPGCPTLVVAGRSYAAERGEPVARHYGADLRVFAHLGHTELVQRAVVWDTVAAWLRGAAPGP